MKKLVLVIVAFIFITSVSIITYAQEQKKSDDKNKQTTADVWRRNFPQSEISTEPALDSVQNEPDNNAENVESAAEIEKTISNLERKLLAAHKQGDAATLSYLLADEIIAIGENTTDSQSDKMGYMDWVTKNSNLKSYKLEKIMVRVYGMTAIATVHYKQQAPITDSSAATDIIATDVWIKRGELWQVVSHHISQMPKS